MSIPGRVIKRIRTDGFIEAFKRFLYILSWRYEQWRIGMSSEITKDIGLGDNDGDCQGYEPVDFRCFKFIMEHMDIIPGQEVLLDYGCGKGRAIILAATYPFKKIIGIERFPELCAIAKKQYHRSKKNLVCKSIEVIEADALTYQIPHDVTMVFFFNPFTGSTLQAALDQIYESLVRNPRVLKIAYIFPKKIDNILADCEWLIQESELPTGYWHYVRSIVYRSKPME